MGLLGIVCSERARDGCRAGRRNGRARCALQAIAALAALAVHSGARTSSAVDLSAGPPSEVQAASSGGGALLVAPTRVVLEGSRRAVEISLVNTGAQTTTYRISFVNLRMTETGEMREIESPGPGDNRADELVRFSPRQVVLEPQVAQSIRLLLRKPAELAAGEYRSHLLLRAVPQAATAGASYESSSDATGLQVSLTPVYGVTVPVLVRHGETSASLTLSELELLPPSRGGDPPSLSLVMHRSGNRSVYGDFSVSFLSGTRRRHVGLTRGVAVYVPNTRRVIQVPLRSVGDTRLAAGRLCVEFKERSGVSLVEACLDVP